MMLAAVSPVLIEEGLTAVAIVFALIWPTFGQAFFRPIEHALSKLAWRRGWAVLTVGLSAFLLRLAILPLVPIPRPFVPDDFSFLLAAKTFALGRLTNPTPPMWTHFESFHIDMQPTYMSMYFPAQGLILAAGKVLTGNPWFGLLAVTALMCAAICWMLQAWLPPSWAFLGGMIAVLHLGLFSYWINTFTGAASIAALGGALILGAFPRIVRAKRSVLLRHLLLLTIGIVIVALSRPYEGLLLCIPVAVVLGRWMFFAPNRPKPSMLLRLAALPVLILLCAGLWMAHYDRRVNGNALTLPYTINRATYAVAPYWIWQKPNPEPAYRHKAMRDFYTGDELPFAQRAQTLSGFLALIVVKPYLAARFLAGIALLPPLLLIPRALRDRRIRFFALAACVWIPGMLIEVFLLPHYLAVFTAALYCVALEAMRHARVYRILRRKTRRRPTGVGLTRFLMATVIVMVALRAFAAPLGLKLDQWPGTAWNFNWYGPAPFGEARAQIEDRLEALPGKQLVFVRYGPTHYPADEWAYNEPYLEGSKIIWAREVNAASDLELIHYYQDRKVWLVEPDDSPIKLSVYSDANLKAASGEPGNSAVRREMLLSAAIPPTPAVRGVMH